MASNGIILDLDGTLAYTLDDIQTAVNNMLTRLGYKTRTKTEVLKFINNGARELVRRSLPKNVQDAELIIDTAVSVYEEEYAKCYCDKTCVYDGMKEALSHLKKKGYKLAVISNKQDKFVKTIISKLFDKKLFSVVMGQGALPAKPDPSSTLLACKQMGVKPGNCIFVGDSDVDMKTAKNAEIKAIGVSWGYREVGILNTAGADYIAEAPEEMREIIEKVLPTKTK